MVLTSYTRFSVFLVTSGSQWFPVVISLVSSSSQWFTLVASGYQWLPVLPSDSQWFFFFFLSETDQYHKR